MLKTVKPPALRERYDCKLNGTQQSVTVFYPGLRHDYEERKKELPVWAKVKNSDWEETEKSDVQERENVITGNQNLELTQFRSTNATPVALPGSPSSDLVRKKTSNAR